MNTIKNIFAKYKVFILLSILLVFIIFTIAFNKLFIKDSTNTKNKQEIANYTQVSALNIPNWKKDNEISNGLKQFLRSCQVILRKKPETTITEQPYVTTVLHWQHVCDQGELVQSESIDKIYEYLENNFNFYLVGKKDEAFITGYFNITLNGSLTPTDKFKYPVYKKPDDLISIDLSRYIKDLESNSVIFGRLIDGKFYPYHTREDINSKGVLKNQNLEILWVDNKVDLFMLHVQGSGRVRLQDGSIVSVGYAAKNGRPYRSIGSTIVELGLLARDQIDMFTIYKTLEENPDLEDRILNTNESYIFFEERKGVDVIGAMNVPLAAKRSVAVDTKYIALGTPIWLETTYPNTNNSINSLVVAQDIGSAIKGNARLDYYWGSGKEATFWAAQMKNKGSIYIMLPKP